jgi:hypothetical protein
MRVSISVTGGDCWHFLYKILERGSSVGFSFLPPLPSFQDPVLICQVLLSLPLQPLTQGLKLPGPALTGHVELDGFLYSHISSREGHLAGKVGAMVLGPGDESEH